MSIDHISQGRSRGGLQKVLRPSDCALDSPNKTNISDVMSDIIQTIQMSQGMTLDEIRLLFGLHLNTSVLRRQLQIAERKGGIAIQKTRRGHTTFNTYVPVGTQQNTEAVGERRIPSAMQ